MRRPAIVGTIGCKRRCSRWFWLSGELQTRLCAGLCVIGGIATESGELRTGGGDCGLIMIWVGGGVRTGAVAPGGGFGDRGGGDARCFAKGGQGTVGVGGCALERCGIQGG